MSAAFIALGSNLGDRQATLRQAVDRLRTLGDVESVSSVYETVPVGVADDQPLYLNAVLCLRTALMPDELIGSLLSIEADLGRQRTFPNAPRTLDLDLLLYDDRVIEEEGLTVPHPRLHERAFVLVPLAEIAGSVVHPALGMSIDELLVQLGPTTGVERWKPPAAITEPR